MEHKISHSYQICEIDSSKDLGFDRKQEALVNTHQSYDSFEEAMDWINREGETGVNYTILEVIRKTRIA